MSKSKKRLEMGEDAWTEYQRDRNRQKARSYYSQKGKYATSWRIRVKQKLIAYKGGECEICGYDKDVPGAFDFHHRNPDEKNFGIGSYICLNFDKLKTESDKCQLLCRNCHAEIHHKWNQKSRQELLDAHAVWERSKLVTRECKACHKTFQPKKGVQKHCSSECGNKGRRKVNRPNERQLKKMLKTMSLESIGRIYEVSGNAVKKW